MMADLIDRAALKKHIRPPAEGDYRQAVMIGDARKYSMNFSIEAPTVDAVEVVRCKDCEYFEIDEDGIDVLGCCKNNAIATNYGGEIYPKENDFCSYGEKRRR